MRTRTRRRRPQIVVREGKPAAVILDIDEYQEMLERLEDVEALKDLEEMRKKPLKFRKLGDFLKEHSAGV
ncbi:MAG: type II toxin-antitoxin system prevent-host-death family antitoxin [Planctomycetota bacterium]